jgi:hypothetical protein
MRFIISVFAILFGVFFMSPLMAADSSNAVKVVISQIQERPYHIKVEIPQLQGLADQSIQQKVNQNIYEVIYKYIENFKQDVTKNKTGSGLEKKGNLTITSKTLFADHKYLSVMLEITAYHGHMAHPDNQLQTLNYYLPEAKLLELKDLFTTGDYLKTIAVFAQKDLIGRLPKLYDYDPKAMPEHFNYNEVKAWVERGTEAKAQNYQHFSLQPQQLVFYFDYYQVGPRPFGVMEVTVPLTNLQNILQPKYRNV